MRIKTSSTEKVYYDRVGKTVTKITIYHMFTFIKDWPFVIHTRQEVHH